MSNFKTRSDFRELSGWGRTPRERCYFIQESKLDLIRDCILGSQHTSVAPRGLGRSYGDSSLNKNQAVMSQLSRNRILAFDPDSGILECEAGVAIADIISVFGPRGWYPTVTPGTKFVTVGGAIAADIHGKNHHQIGSFGQHVIDISILTADGEIRFCSPNQTPDLFWATVGGMGLTGLILTAKIKLRKITNSFVFATYKKTKNLEETLGEFASFDTRYYYSVAWIDCLAKGSSLGRSIVMFANDAMPEQLHEQHTRSKFEFSRNASRTIRFDFPSFALNRYTIGIFNSIYYSMAGGEEKTVSFDKYFYPLDSINDWNRAYGKKGFIQYQVLFPMTTSALGLSKILELVAREGRGSFLAVLKKSGNRSGGILSYLFPGYTLALDFPFTGEDLVRFVRNLDDITLQLGGRVYLSKDALIQPREFNGMYPEVDKFLRVKAKYDPKFRFMTSQGRRLGL